MNSHFCCHAYEEFCFKICPLTNKFDAFDRRGIFFSSDQQIYLKHDTRKLSLWYFFFLFKHTRKAYVQMIKTSMDMGNNLAFEWKADSNTLPVISDEEITLNHLLSKAFVLSIDKMFVFRSNRCNSHERRVSCHRFSQDSFQTPFRFQNL